VHTVTRSSLYSFDFEMGDMAQREGSPTALVMGGREWAMLLALAVLWGSSFFFFKIMVAALSPFSGVWAFPPSS
jgi:hypothetical protein